MSFVAVFLFAASLSAQTGGAGALDLYGLQAHGAFPILIDGKVRLKLGAGHHLTVHLSQGEHQVECKGGKLDPVKLIDVEPNETTYVTLEYKSPNLFAVGFLGSDPYKTMSLLLEHTNAPPAGTFKEQDVDRSTASALLALPPFQESVLTEAHISIEPLSDTDIRDALLQGRHTTDPKTVGVLLEDMQEQFASATAGTLVSGYSVRVYTAKQWIQLQASLAAREMRPYSEADLAPQMKQRLLYVVALPSTPDKLAGKNMAAASNATRVVLQTGSSKAILQPLSLDPTTVDVESALRSAAYGGVIATFPEPDVSKPFDIVVVGDGYTKHFSVKEKHLMRLR